MLLTSFQAVVETPSTSTEVNVKEDDYREVDKEEEVDENESEKESNPEEKMEEDEEKDNTSEKEEEDKEVKKLVPDSLQNEDSYKYL